MRVNYKQSIVFSFILSQKEMPKRGYIVLGNTSYPIIKIPCLSFFFWCKSNKIGFISVSEL